MRPIPNTQNYFWVHEGTPTATDSVPVGATCFNQTTGASFRFIGGGGWVALPDSLNDLGTVTSTNLGDGIQQFRQDIDADLVTVKIYGVGTAYAFTNTAAAIDFGTTDPVFLPARTGRWLLLSQVQLTYTGATVVAETATLKLRRTNNTAADLASSSVVVDLPVSTTLTHTYGIVSLPPIVYTCSNADDSITIFANVSAGLSAGTIDATSVGTSIVGLHLGI